MSADVSLPGAAVAVPSPGARRPLSAEPLRCKHTCIHKVNGAHAQDFREAARRAQLVEAAAAAFLRARVRRHVDGRRRPRGRRVSRLILYRIFESKPDAVPSRAADPVCSDLAAQFAGLVLDEVRELGASKVIMPVARAHPDAFRLLWRHAWREPPSRTWPWGSATTSTDFARMHPGGVHRRRRGAPRLGGAHRRRPPHRRDLQLARRRRPRPRRRVAALKTVTACRAMAAAWMGRR